MDVNKIIEENKHYWKGYQDGAIQAVQKYDSLLYAMAKRLEKIEAMLEDMIKE